MSYEWLAPREAVLRRPDTHVGAVTVRKVTRVVLGPDGRSPRTVSAGVSPALEKIYDEIVTNAIDHRERDKHMTELRVDVHPESGTIVVTNNGKTAIPTGKWEGTDRHVPEVLFTELNAGSNLGEKNAHNVGGRNGVGGTVCNVLCKSFTIEVCNAEEGVRYVQTMTDNASCVPPPSISKYKLAKSRVRVSMLPDYERLGMPSDCMKNDDLRALLVGRAVDAAACTDASVFVNDAKVGPFKSLKAYAEAFGGTLLGQDRSQGEEGCYVHVVVTCGKEEKAEGDDEGTTGKDGLVPVVHSCFVNGVRCVGRLYDAVMAKLASPLTKQGVAERVATTMISEHVSVFVVSRMNTPRFGSQSKDVLDTPPSKFGFEVPDLTSVAKRIASLSCVQIHVKMRKDLDEGKAARKAMKAEGLGGRSARHVKKYERASEVGKGKQCTLWIPEGDSAKAMIVQGFAVTGRRHHGVYPLRGKILNVHDLTLVDAMKNAEVCDLMHILGLDPTKTYDAASVRKLPYRIMVTTDQDDDGSHIFGLVTTIFYRFFPSILECCPGFIQRFVTPVVKVSRCSSVDGRGGGRAAGGTERPLEFFSLSNYKMWVEEVQGGTLPRGLRASYYKGLGTNTNEEATHYFQNMTSYTKTAMHTAEATSCIRMAFAKDQASKRKEHVDSMTASSTHALYSEPTFSISDFVKEELSLFWMADNVRSIPSVVDGLKPSQRKVLFTVFGSATNAKHKVAQLAGEVAKRTNYHHGEQSLGEVAIKLAQTFQGSNNVNLLKPLGQFGNRHGEKPSQARYLYTAATPQARSLFRSEDDVVLSYLQDEGHTIEPSYYVPVLPTILVNGCEGIGTGYSTSVPPHAVKDVLGACRSACDHVALHGEPGEKGTRGQDGRDEEEETDGSRVVASSSLLVHLRRTVRLVPHVRGFRGSVVCKDNGTHMFKGIHEWTDERTLRILELPPGVKTNAVKEHLQDQACVEDVVSHSTGKDVDLVVKFATTPVPEGWEKLARLSSTLSTTNMHAFDASGRLRKYESTTEIVHEHAVQRLKAYRKRRDHMMSELASKMEATMRRISFLTRVVTRELDLVGTSRAVLREELGSHATELLSIPLDHITPEGVEEYRAKMRTYQSEWEAWEKLTSVDMWREDMDRLEEALRAEGLWEEEEAFQGKTKRAGEAPSLSGTKRERDGVSEWAGP